MDVVERCLGVSVSQLESWNFTSAIGVVDIRVEDSAVRSELYHQ